MGSCTVNLLLDDLNLKSSLDNKTQHFGNKYGLQTWYMEQRFVPGSKPPTA